MAAKGGEEPVLPRSQLDLGDLRHSLQARRGDQRHSRSHAPVQEVKAHSDTSTKPRTRLTARDKGKGVHAAHMEAETAVQEEESVTDSHSKVGFRRSHQ